MIIHNILLLEKKIEFQRTQRDRLSVKRAT